MPEQERPTSAGRGARKGFDRESIANVLIVAIGVSLVCSILVSATAVILQPLQARNEALNRQQNILEVAGLMQPGADVEALFSQIETRIVDLDTGEYVPEMDPGAFDMVEAAGDPELGTAIPKEKDIAGIGRRARFAEVYLLRNETGALQRLILPFYGMGLWGTMYGFVAVEPDGSTIDGLKFYEHIETPGLGGEVDNPRWRVKWEDKRLYDTEGNVRIEVIKGSVPGDGWSGATSNAPDSIYKVDGLSGSTLTSRGVSNMLRYWMGEGGYKAYLEKVWERGTDES